MFNAQKVVGPCLLVLWGVTANLRADDADAKKLIEQVVKTAGGDDKLLSLFRFRERIIVSAVPAAPVKADEPGNRTSVVQVSGDWWLGKDKREKDKVRVLCWGWSLRLLLDPMSKITVLADTTVADKPAFGLRVSESIKEPIDLLFDKETDRLVAIDYSDTRHIFSEWKVTEAGHHYPSHVVGFRYTDRAAGVLSETQWYQTDILELTPLVELPPELRRSN